MGWAAACLSPSCPETSEGDWLAPEMDGQRTPQTRDRIAKGGVGRALQILTHLISVVCGR